MTRRGDIVIVSFPYVSGTGGKNRPAVVIQNDRDNQRLSNTVIAMITGNTSHAQTEPTQLLIDPKTEEGRPTGLHLPSAVKCGNLYTIDQRHILGTIGHLPDSLITRVDGCLRAALGL